MGPGSCYGRSEPHAGDGEIGPAGAGEVAHAICACRLLAAGIFHGDMAVVKFSVELESGRDVRVRWMIHALDLCVRLAGAES